MTLPGSTAVLIEQAAAEIADASSVVALTGAGISCESGIPAFRGPGGLWEKIDPMKYATIEAFERDPVTVWNVLIKDMKTVLEQAVPNRGHTGLVALEQMGKLQTVITQNVDGLHQLAGNTDVIEFHGTFAWHRCTGCNQRHRSAAIDMSEIPPRCDCGDILRPDVVFFGEMIPADAMIRSRNAASACDLMLVVGSSATVQPAASIPVIAKGNGAVIVEINPEPTPLTSDISDYLLQGEAGSVMDAMVSVLKRARSQ